MKTSIRFMKHYVTDGKTKARVSYSASTYTDGRIGVTLYAKSFGDGDALAKILPDQYKNETDSQTDYFEKGRVRINQGESLYAAALARTQEAANMKTKETTHTPGPWRRSTGHNSYIVGDRGGIIARVEAGSAQEEALAEANARLIASAPDLLAALKIAEDAMEAALFTINAAVNAKAVTFASVDNPSVNLKYQLNSVRAAILRAEGGK